MLPLVAILLTPPTDAGSAHAAVSATFADQCQMCHSAGADLDLSVSPSALVGVLGSTGAPLVAPGDPDGSYLLQKMIGSEGIDGQPMPLGGSASEASIAAVRDWIAALPVDTPAGEPPPKPALPNFFGTHQIAHNTTTTLGKRTIEMRIHHRFGQVGARRSYLGLAGGAVMSLGVAYGIIDGLDVLARWSNSRLDWELGVKYAPIRQADGKPLSFAGYASFEALTDFPERAGNRLTGNFQAMISRLWFDRWSTQLLLNYSLLTNHAPVAFVDFGDGPEPADDQRGTFDVALATSVWLGKKKKWGIDAEYMLPIPDGGTPNLFYYSGGDGLPSGPRYGGYGIGVAARAGLHLFQVFATNVQDIHTSLIAPGGQAGNPFKGEFFLGFNISRKWKL